MRIVILTGNAIRHKYVANALVKRVDDALVVVECRQNDSGNQENSLVAEHFNLRSQIEEKIFKGNDFFLAKTLPLLTKETNLQYTYTAIKNFNPDVMFVFGSSIIRDPLLSLMPPGRFINLHLGLSPYYRGSGTNFWPFVNEELEYVGSTILHVDAGVDTGDIITHVRPEFFYNDNVHTVGCKVIIKSVVRLVKLLDLLEKGQELNRVKQWKANNERHYRNKDFNEDIVSYYKQNLEDGLIDKYLSRTPKKLRLVK